MHASLSLALLGASLVAGASIPNAGAAKNPQAQAQGAGNTQTAQTGNTQTGNTQSTGNTATTGTTGTTGTQTASAPGNAVSAANVKPGQNPFMALQGNAQYPQLTAAQKTGLQNAAVLWSQDTAVVSSALSLLGSGKMSDQDFRDTADMAYMAEVNELMQKNYIDALIGQMPQLTAATTSLGNGSFAIVVDQLREMRIRGPANMTFVQAAVAGMNNLRCRQVLLAIDAYVLSANQAGGNNTFISATRPPACQSLYAQTADVLPAGAVTNATTFPTASQLISQFNQAPRFMVSNAIAFSQTSGSDNTPALGSQYTTQYPFTNTSSLAGQLLAFNGQPEMTNGAASNLQANPLNAVLFANQVGGNTAGAQTGNTAGAQTGNTAGAQTGNTQTAGAQTGNTQTAGAQTGNAQTAGAAKAAPQAGAAKGAPKGN